VSKESFTTAGRTGKFSVTNWSPLTGIGLFDANYNVATGEMIITIKVCITFSDFNQKWNEIEKGEWQKNLFEIVSKFWTDRYLLQCTREGWSEFVVQVKVNLELAPKTDAHVDIQVRKTMPDEPTSGGGVGWSAKPPLLSIDDKTIYPKDQLKQREAIFNLRMVQMGEAIRDHQVGFIPFNKDSSELNSETKMKLMKFARFINRISTNDIRGIQLVVYGHTAGSDSFMKMGLGKRRAQAVASALDTALGDNVSVFVTDSDSSKAGLKSSILKTLTDFHKRAVTSTSIQGVCISVRVPKAVSHAAEKNYIVICHEFGHMLGLPDEYMGALHPLLTERANADNMISKTFQRAIKDGDPEQWQDSHKRIRGQQAGMAEMLRYNTDVRSPTFLTQTEVIDSTMVATSSIMHSGMEVMPAHYLTVWSCLAEMTWDHLPPTAWKIVPSPRNRDAIRYFRPA
jgi:hypothetical protein